MLATLSGKLLAFMSRSIQVAKLFFMRQSLDSGLKKKWFWILQPSTTTSAISSWCSPCVLLTWQPRQSRQFDSYFKRCAGSPKHLKHARKHAGNVAGRNGRAASEIIQSLNNYAHIVFAQNSMTSPALFVRSDVNMTFGRWTFLIWSTIWLCVQPAISAMFLKSAQIRWM